MKTYFSRITADHWIRHNNAEKQAHTVAIEMNRILIPEDEMQQFQQTFLQKIAQVNKNNPRCKPLELEIWNLGDEMHGGPDFSKDYCLSISGVFNMSLFHVKGT